MQEVNDEQQAPIERGSWEDIWPLPAADSPMEEQLDDFTMRIHKAVGRTATAIDMPVDDIDVMMITMAAVKESLALVDPNPYQRFHFHQTVPAALSCERQELSAAIASRFIDVFKEWVDALYPPHQRAGSWPELEITRYVIEMQLEEVRPDVDPVIH